MPEDTKTVPDKRPVEGQDTPPEQTDQPAEVAAPDQSQVAGASDAPDAGSPEVGAPAEGGEALVSDQDAQAVADGVEPADGQEPVEDQDAAPADAEGGEVQAAPQALNEDPPMSDDEAVEELDRLRDEEVAFSWQASEYVHHHKGLTWYAGLAIGLAVLVAVSALMGMWINIVMIGVMGAAVFVYARKAPKTMMYELTPKGVTIAGKQYLYTEFKSFGVLPEEEWHTIDLEPTQRFSPRLAMLYDPEDFDEIVGHLELHLPRVDRDPDIIERATRYLRF